MQKYYKKLAVILCAAALLLVFIFMQNAGKKQASVNKKGEQPMQGTGIDGTYKKQEGSEVIYFAGGCFWGTEKLFQSLPGVLNAVTGYANGKAENTPTYELVCRGGTGFKETVRVVYDPKIIELKQLLEVYFLAIDPTVYDAQGNDTGTQYQTGIYYNDKASGEITESFVAEEQKKHKVFAVEHQPLINFYDAEEYHQDYLDKNPKGYCHISPLRIEKAVQLIEKQNSEK